MNNQYILSKEEQHNNNLCGCYFHPKEVIVGVCAPCLKEKLLILASKQGHSDNLASLKSHHHHNKKSILTVIPSKIFTDLWGNSFSFLHRRRRCHSSEFQNYKSKDFDHNDDDDDDDDDDDRDTSTSQEQEDSFISIKFQDNGVASWDKGTTNYNKVSSFDQPCFNNNTFSTNAATNNKPNYNYTNTNKKEMITTATINSKEGPNTKSVIEHVNTHATLRWRKRIGQILQLIKWKRSSKDNVRHVVNKVDGVKIRKSWIRSLTKRRRTMDS